MPLSLGDCDGDLRKLLFDGFLGTSARVCLLGCGCTSKAICFTGLTLNCGGDGFLIGDLSKSVLLTVKPP